ncbi:MAG: hypothetical protein RKH07_03700 [Gammaproteobacteria bacterium]
MPIRTLSRAMLLLAGSLLIACSGGDDAEPDAQSATPYNTSLSVQELMALIIEPAADVLWDSGGWVLDSAGYEELYPTTDDGWEYVRAQSALIVETGNLLALPGRAEDNDAWMIYSEGMMEAGLRSMAAAEAQDEEEFFQAGAQLYSVCSACHQAYNPDINNRFTSD